MSAGRSRGSRKVEARVGPRSSRCDRTDRLAGRVGAADRRSPARSRETLRGYPDRGAWCGRVRVGACLTVLVYRAGCMTPRDRSAKSWCCRGCLCSWPRSPGRWHVRHLGRVAGRRGLRSVVAADTRSRAADGSRRGSDPGRVRHDAAGVVTAKPLNPPGERTRP